MSPRFIVAALAVSCLAVGCLADGHTSARGCGMLGIPPGDGTDMVCATAELTKCRDSVKGLVAERKCEKKGARLCTLEELEAGEGSMPGCDGELDDAMFWTETPCDDEDKWVVAKKDGSDPTCMKKKSKKKKAAVMCCADLEDPIFTFFIGNGTDPTPDGQVTPHFQFFADPFGMNAFFGRASMFRGLTYRIQRIVDDEEHPFDIATFMGEDGPIPLSIPHYSNVEEDRGIKFIGEWIQFTLPLDHPDSMVYHSTEKPDEMFSPFIIGTIFYVTGPNTEGDSAFSYFEAFNELDGFMPIRKFKSNKKGVPKLVRGEMYRFLPINMEETGFLLINTAPVKEAFPVIYGLPIAGQFAQFMVPPGYEGKVKCSSGNDKKIKDPLRVVDSL